MTSDHSTPANPYLNKHCIIPLYWRRVAASDRADTDQWTAGAVDRDIPYHCEVVRTDDLDCLQEAKSYIEYAGPLESNRPLSCAKHTAYVAICSPIQRCLTLSAKT